MPDSDQDRAALRTLLDEWWTPPAHLVATIPKGGAFLKYLGHAETTRALIESDPAWIWTPMALDPNGLPLLDRGANGDAVGLWILLTVHGVTRPGYGSCLPGKSDAIKELIGDAIRNAALRFGCAGSLWSKSADAPAPMGKHPVPAAPAAAAKGWSERRCRAEHDALVVEFGVASVALSFAHFDIVRLAMLDDKMLSDIREHLLANRPPEDSTPF